MLVKGATVIHKGEKYLLLLSPYNCLMQVSRAKNKLSSRVLDVTLVLELLLDIWYIIFKAHGEIMI